MKALPDPDHVISLVANEAMMFLASNGTIDSIDQMYDDFCDTEPIEEYSKEEFIATIHLWVARLNARC